jgi:hypothetical protein
MTGVYFESGGQIEPYAELLSTTADFTIFTATVDLTVMIVSLNAAATGNSTFFLWIDKGATDVQIVPGETITAPARLKIENHPVKLRPGWALKCKAGTAGNISVTASLALIGKINTTPNS